MTKRIQRRIKRVMSSAAFSRRGLRHGGAMLNSTINVISREYFHLVVRYPADQQLVMVMLVTRGVASAGRVCAEQAAFLLVLAKSRCYASRDTLMPYGSLVAE